MQWSSMLAIYALFWVLSAFLVMPIGIKTHAEDGLEIVPGQADSAPSNFRPGLILLRTTLVSTVLFTAFYLNFEYGWITPQDLNFFGSPPPSASHLR